MQAFTKAAGCNVETRDISLAGRILAQFPDAAREEPSRRRRSRGAGRDRENARGQHHQVAQHQRFGTAAHRRDQRAEAARLRPPRLSRGAAQRRRAGNQGEIREGARQRGQPRAARRQFGPPRRGHPSSSTRRSTRTRWAVGARIRRPTSRAWRTATSTRASSRPSCKRAASSKIELTSNRGDKTVLKDGISVKEGDVLAASSMSRRALREFFSKQIADAKSKGVLLSLHLKATMMKVSDPIMFGHAVDVYYQDALQKHADTLKRLGVRAEQRRGRSLREDQVVAGRRARRHRGGSCSRVRKRGPSSRWSTPRKASRTCTCRATSSSTPRCRLRSAPRARCGAPTASCTTRRH